MKSKFSKAVSTGKSGFWKFTLYLSLFHYIIECFFYDMICLINTDSIFPLVNVNAEDIYPWYLLEVIIKYSVKFLY